MKQILFFLVILIILFTCKDINPEFLEETKHELFVFNSKTSNESRSNGSYFLIGGNYSSSTKEYTNAVFMWKSISGEFIRSTMNLDKIRVSINDSIINPYIVFFGINENAGKYDYPTDYQSFIDDFIDYAVIYCHSKDFPKNINLLSIQN